jgi:hypothetical protein
VTIDGVRISNSFIDHSQVVTTNKYNALADCHATNHSILDRLSVLPLVFVAALNNVFTSRFLATDVNAVTRSLTKLHAPNIRISCPQILTLLVHVFVVWKLSPTDVTLGSIPRLVATPPPLLELRNSTAPSKTQSQSYSCSNRPYVTSSVTRRWVCLLWICLACATVGRMGIA